ncbi:serine/threonine-protein kinase BLUS1-like [Abeliophyllum distichum]|uniref:Serine/threonine-protein kinase BLUS1-like n=1 Tax=Abeliophyllum distichum TaxID=126358 RepID=A0ABD1TF65_9LAMI
MAPQNLVGKKSGDEHLILKKFRLDCNIIDEEIGRSIFSSTPNAQNVVEIKRNFYLHHRFSCASMAIMSECSLRYIISKQFTASTGAVIKLGFQASTYEHDQEREMASTSTLPLRDISKWGSAPEIYWGEVEDYKPHSDIWLVGITALELGYRWCFSKLKMIADEVTVLEKKFKSMLRKGESEFSPEFEKVVVKCLSEKPEMRPAVNQLLQFEFFSNE